MQPEHALVLSRRRRILFVALALAPLALTGLASCILADPPPALPTYIEQAPVIYGESSIPPADLSTLNWPQEGLLNFTVPVLLYAPTYFFVFVDYHTANSQLLEQLTLSPTVDGGGNQIASFSVNPSSPSLLLGSSCHRITFVADADPTAPDNVQTRPPPATLTQCSLCSEITWVFDPTGTGGCPTYDAGPIRDAEIFRDSPSIHIPSG